MSDPITFRLTVGWRSYLMTAADAAKVMELLCKAVCVDSGYLEGEDGHVLIDATREDLSLVPANGRRMTRDEFKRAQDSERKARDEAAKAAAEQEVDQ